MTPLPITVIVLTKNESAVIARTVENLRDFGQVLVVDSLSEDGTAAIAAELGATVIPFEWNGKYPKKKQWALEHDNVEHDWVLYVDADEFPSQELIGAIRAEFSHPNVMDLYGAYDIPISYTFTGTRLKHGHQVKKRALINRLHARFPEIDDLDVATMWEVEGHYQPVTAKPIGNLLKPIIHDDIDPLYDYFSRHNRYSDWEARLITSPTLAKSVRSARTKQGRIFDRVPLKPIAFFLYSFLAKRGFLDGRAGFNYAVALAFYYWQISIKAREYRRRGDALDGRQKNSAERA